MTAKSAVPRQRAVGTCPECTRTGVRLAQSGPLAGKVLIHRWPDDSTLRCNYRGFPVEAGAAGGAAGPAVVRGSREKIAEDKEALLAAAEERFKRVMARAVDEAALSSKRDELAGWWAGQAQAEIGMVVDKAIEYGATDLRDLGRQIYEMAGRPQPDDAVATEAGISFYLMGKVSRIAAAFREGRLPSSDTWLDIGVYARMAQRVRQIGAWPGV